MDDGLPFRNNRLLQGLVAWLLLFWVVTAIAPYNRFDWLLENLLVFIYGAILVVTYRYFAFGLLIAYPMRELLLRLAKVRVGWSYFLAVTLVLAFSGFYEIVEAWVAMIVSPELGAAYLGTQGDVWDAQSDMGLALLGAVTAMLCTWLALHHKGR